MKLTPLPTDLPPLPDFHVQERDRWLRAKAGRLGGSSAAAAIGVSRHKSRVRLWGEMTGRLAVEGADDSEPALFGCAFESRIVDELIRRTGGRYRRAGEGEKPVARDVGAYRIHPYQTARLYESREHPRLVADMDEIIVDREDGSLGLVEAKAPGFRAGAAWRSDGLPPEPVVQSMHYAGVTGLRFALIAAVVGGQRSVAFRLDADDERLERLVSKELRFLRYVDEDECPPDYHAGTLADWKALYPRDDGGVVDLGHDAARAALELAEARAAQKAAEDRAKAAEAQVVAMMGGAAFGRLPAEEPHDLAFKSSEVKPQACSCGAVIRRGYARRSIALRKRKQLTTTSK